MEKRVGLRKVYKTGGGVRRKEGKIDKKKLKFFGGCVNMSFREEYKQSNWRQVCAVLRKEKKKKTSGSGLGF